MSSYEETVWFVEPERGASVPRAGSNQHELRSFGRFWYREIREFLIRRRTVTRELPAWSPPPSRELRRRRQPSPFCQPHVSAFATPRRPCMPCGPSARSTPPRKPPPPQHRGRGRRPLGQLSSPPVYALPSAELGLPGRSGTLAGLRGRTACAAASAHCACRTSLSAPCSPNGRPVVPRCALGSHYRARRERRAARSATRRRQKNDTSGSLKEAHLASSSSRSDKPPPGASAPRSSAPLPSSVRARSSCPPPSATVSISFSFCFSI